MALPNRLNKDELEKFSFRKVSPYKAHHKRYNWKCFRCGIWSKYLANGLCKRCSRLPEQIIRPFIDTWNESDRTRPTLINELGIGSLETLPSTSEAISPSCRGVFLRATVKISGVKFFGFSASGC